MYHFKLRNTQLNVKNGPKQFLFGSSSPYDGWDQFCTRSHLYHSRDLCRPASGSVIWVTWSVRLLKLGVIEPSLDRQVAAPASAARPHQSELLFSPAELGGLNVILEQSQNVCLRVAWLPASNIFIILIKHCQFRALLLNTYMCYISPLSVKVSLETMKFFWLSNLCTSELLQKINDDSYPFHTMLTSEFYCWRFHDIVHAGTRYDKFQTTFEICQKCIHLSFNGGEPGQGNNQ